VTVLEFIVDLLFTGPWFWVGVGLGLVGAWIAWTYLPASVDRASIAAVIFIAGCVLGGVLATIGEKRK
jgi:hypothetical protein